MEANIFKLHPNSIIGYKKLSNSDLGQSSGNTTHIGLFENTLTFLPRESSVSTAQLIYNRTSTEFICLLDYIQNSDGSRRSPKIRKGLTHELIIDGKKLDSVVIAIRHLASQSPYSTWYLIWFGLDNEDLVFLLFNDESDEYRIINQVLALGARGQVNKENNAYYQLLEYLNQLVVDANIKYLEELEIISQTREEAITTRRIKPRRIDIHKANEFFKQTGKNGEELVFKYLEQQKRLNKIRDFKWMNQSKESGYPYDFEITYLNNELFFTDVKSTIYNFKQKMIFSSSEILFMNQNKNYQVHRVFELGEEPKLRICNNINHVASLFIPHYSNFKSQLEQNGLNLSGLKIGVSPTLNSLHFEMAIGLRSLMT